MRELLTPKERNTAADVPSVNKYSNAGQVLGEVLKKLIPQITPGKKVLDLCIESVYLWS